MFNVLMFITGVNDTGDKLFSGVNDNGEKFIAGVIDTGEQFIFHRCRSYRSEKKSLNLPILACLHIKMKN
jgi:hypothetical protein